MFSGAQNSIAKKYQTFLPYVNVLKTLPLMVNPKPNIDTLASIMVALPYSANFPLLCASIPYCVLTFPYSVLTFPYSVLTFPYSVLTFPYSVLTFPYSVLTFPYSVLAFPTLC